MREKWKRCFQDWSTTSEFQEKIESSRNIIQEKLKQYSRPYIAFSGGKDSLCVLHLVLQENPNTTVVHWDYGKYYFPHSLFQEVQEIISQFLVQDFRVYSSEKYDILKRKAINILGQEFLAEVVPHLKAEGFDLVFVGLRKEEGSRRKLRIEKSLFLTEIPESHPIADWTWLDIWAYIISRDLPYLSYYDTYGEIIGWDKVRLSTFFDPEFEKFGSANIQGVLSWKFKNTEGVSINAKKNQAYTS